MESLDHGEPLAVEFMNTVYADRDGVHDALDTADGMDAWVRTVGLDHRLGDVRQRRMSLAQRRRFTDLRDAVRTMAAAVTDDTRAAALPTSAELESAVTLINTASALAPRWPTMIWQNGSEPRCELRSDTQFADTALSLMADYTIRFFTGSDRKLLRACLAPACVLYFVRDHGRREWCSAGCGNRARVARHYRRHHGASL